MNIGFLSALPLLLLERARAVDPTYTYVKQHEEHVEQENGKTVKHTSAAQVYEEVEGVNTVGELLFAYDDASILIRSDGTMELKNVTADPPLDGTPKLDDYEKGTEFKKDGKTIAKVIRDEDNTVNLLQVEDSFIEKSALPVGHANPRVVDMRKEMIEADKAKSAVSAS
eukprot:GHVU01065010.1.p1 GENE.GHVU01065010.1~~GHVU01065010.1.p1  ORF type:complete len:169 (+),score=30.33 GHVU01065010.1:64-570(+)